MEKEEIRPLYHDVVFKDELYDTIYTDEELKEMGKYKEKKESYTKKYKVKTKIAFEDYNGENMVH